MWNRVYEGSNICHKKKGLSFNPKEIINLNPAYNYSNILKYQYLKI